MDLILNLITLPIIFGFICLLIPERVKYIREVISIGVSLAVFYLAFRLFLIRPLSWEVTDIVFFNADNLASFIVLAIGLFGFLICLYSAKFMSKLGNLRQYYAYVLMTLGASIAAILANDLRILLISWGFLGFTLYLLISLGGAKASDASKKTFIIVGGSDALVLVGIGIIWHLTSSFDISQINLKLVGALPILAYFCLIIGSFAKAGAMPFHTWIPASSEVAPIPVMAYLPASLDKLLGIYLLARISFDIFKLEPGSMVSIVMMTVGAITIIAAVMMALVQHNFKKLLSYHAVSQVGYMVLGIGTGIPVGIAGGLFHMLNHAIYKCCLFLTGGSVQHQTGTSELNELGGLAKFMPITFISCLIASFSISGIPPFNGFVSKWMVYQGIIDLGVYGLKIWPILLIATMFGSGLTLASFMKLIHATFLGQGNRKDIREVSWMMWIPMVILAILCVVFGIYAYQVPLKYFINPSVKGAVLLSGVWMPSLATGLIILGIIMGFVIFIISNFIKSLRVGSTYVGGEVIDKEDRVTGVDFYNTIKDFKILKIIYKKAENNFFDIYEQGKKLVFSITKRLQYIHNGILPTYLVWSLLGMIILFWIMAMK